MRIPTKFLLSRRVSVSELWGFQRGYRVSLHQNRKSVKIQRANQLKLEFIAPALSFS